MENFYTITIETLGNLWAEFLLVVPSVLLAIIVFLVGLAIAVLVARLIERVFKFLLIDRLLGKLGLEGGLKKFGFKLNSGKLIGGIVKWFVIIVFLVAVADMLNLEGVSEFLTRIVFYIPNIVAAVVIIFAATILAYFVERVIVRSIKAAGYGEHGFVAGIAKWSILIFAVLAALTQLGVVPDMIKILFTGLITMLAIAGGLAFGLGGQDLAGEILDKVKKDFRKRK